MNVTHKRGTKELRKNGTSNFLLTAPNGNFLSLANKPLSDYDGWYVYDALAQQHFKLLANITQSAPSTFAKSPAHIANHGSWIERQSSVDGSACREQFFFLSEGVVYTHKGSTPACIDLDCKFMNDDDTHGRIYTVEHRDDLLTVRYTKFTDDSCSQVQYTRTLLLHIVSCGAETAQISLTRTWKACALPYDTRRGMQASRHIYELGSIGGAYTLLCAQGDSLEAATHTLAALRDAYVKTVNDARTNAFAVPDCTNDAPDDLLIDVAYHAHNALLISRDDASGIFAGYPWFYQFWMRDEAMSMWPLLEKKNYALIKALLLRWVDKIARNQTQANDDVASNRSADGPGIVAMRLHQLLSQLASNKTLSQHFTLEELNYLFTTFSSYLETLAWSHELVQSGLKQTWMDTIERSGARIEIQSCTLNVYSLLELLSKLFGKKRQEKVYANLLKKLRKQIRNVLFCNGKLHDGLHEDGSLDICVRPNIFLAWYFTPNLFSAKEWSKAFEQVLPELLLEWGGLASVGINDPAFVPVHSGVHDVSYHNGDSWYYINNIAALALFTVDAHKFEDTIHAIVQASTHDLLCQGYQGHASEVSDAGRQRAGGCKAQAWSIATFIELLEKMRR